jgi:hypothetical protein
MHPLLGRSSLVKFCSDWANTCETESYCFPNFTRSHQSRVLVVRLGIGFYHELSYSCWQRAILNTCEYLRYCVSVSTETPSFHVMQIHAKVINSNFNNQQMLVLRETAIAECRFSVQVFRSRAAAQEPQLSWYLFWNQMLCTCIQCTSKT